MLEVIKENEKAKMMARAGSLLLLALAPLHEAAFTGRGDCPCLNTTHVTAEPATGCLAVAFDQSINSNSTCGVGNPLCYPPDYGMGSCQAWDWDLGPMWSASKTARRGATPR